MKKLILTTLALLTFSGDVLANESASVFCNIETKGRDADGRDLEEKRVILFVLNVVTRSVEPLMDMEGSDQVTGTTFSVATLHAGLSAVTVKSPSAYHPEFIIYVDHVGGEVESDINEKTERHTTMAYCSSQF